MELPNILVQYSVHVDRLIRLIQDTPEDKYVRRLSERAWSVAQVADHVYATTERCLTNALSCANGEGARGRSGFGPMIFSWMVSFPPIRLRIKKIPPGTEDIYTPRSIPKHEAIDQLKKSVDDMRRTIDTVRDCDPDVRIAHWAGGWFNAQQWIHSAEMHIKHHFRQLSRIEKQLSR